jgi:hypothetical protein
MGFRIGHLRVWLRAAASTFLLTIVLPRLISRETHNSAISGCVAK